MQYVVSAYAVIWILLVLYVVSLAMRTARLGREAELLARLAAGEESSRATE